MKYKILWLDDERPELFDDLCEQYKESIDFEHIYHTDICEDKIKQNAKDYDAVILDINGKASHSENASRKDFYDLVASVLNKKLLLYIYTGNIDFQKDDDCGFLSPLNGNMYEGSKENIFDKRDGEPEKMINKILKDLEANYKDYAEHRYILDFFRKDWIDHTLKVSVDRLMKCYNSKSDSKYTYNDNYGTEMRKIVHVILYKIKKEYNLKDEKYGGIISEMENDERMKNPSICFNPLIIQPLRQLLAAGNFISHKNTDSNIVDEYDRKLYFDLEFSAFFVVTNWFNKTMKEIEREKGKIELDKGDKNKQQTQNTTENNPIILSSEQEPTENRMEDTKGNRYKRVKIHTENGTHFIKVKVPSRIYREKVVNNELWVSRIDPKKEGDEWYIFCRDEKDLSPISIKE